MLKKKHNAKKMKNIASVRQSNISIRDDHLHETTVTKKYKTKNNEDAI